MEEGAEVAQPGTAQAWRACGALPLGGSNRNLPGEFAFQAGCLKIPPSAPKYFLKMNILERDAEKLVMKGGSKEGGAGFEPAYADLQSATLPLGDPPLMSKDGLLFNLFQSPWL